MVDWAGHARREDERYRDGEARLPDAEDQDARQRQLTRMGNAAAGAGLANLMAGLVSEKMFQKMEAHEKEIRSNAAARNTALLKKVFSRNWSTAAS